MSAMLSSLEPASWHAACKCMLSACLQVLQAVPETVQGILITAGGHGAAYCFRAVNGAPLIKGFVPVLKVKVSDTTGAGDAFLSGFLYSMVKVKFPLQSDTSC